MPEGDYIALTKARPLCWHLRYGNNLFNVIGRGVDAALITAGRRWPLGPVGMGGVDSISRMLDCLFLRRMLRAVTSLARHLCNAGNSRLALFESRRGPTVFLLQHSFSKCS